jgi:nicotinic acid mononucleotide adenylyltransferase
MPTDAKPKFFGLFGKKAAVSEEKKPEGIMLGGVRVTSYDFPMDKITQCIGDKGGTQSFGGGRTHGVVLFNTGSYCPPDKTLNLLFETARLSFLSETDTTQQNIHRVIGGFACPSGAAYLDNKMLVRNGLTSISGEDRLAMTKCAVGQYIEASEVEVVRTARLDFSDVGAALKKYLATATSVAPQPGARVTYEEMRERVQVWYVCGSAHANDNISPNMPGPYRLANGDVWADGIIIVEELTEFDGPARPEFVTSDTLRIVRAAERVPSSAFVLDAMRVGRPIDRLVPECVARYIADRGITFGKYVPGETKDKYIANRELSLMCDDPPTERDFPLTKILGMGRIVERQASKVHAPRRVVVLFNTGSYCPPHIGHSELFSKARDEIERANYIKRASGEYRNVIVIGGFAIPSVDDYVDRKVNAKGLTSIPGIHRFGLTDVILADMPHIGHFVAASPFEVRRRDFCDYPVVGAALRSYLLSPANAGAIRESFKLPHNFADAITIEVWYVCGSDHVMNTGIPEKGPYVNRAGNVWADGVIAVVREGVAEKERLTPEYQNSGSFLIVEAGATSVSSSEIRNRLASGQSVEGLLPQKAVDYIDHYGIRTRKLVTAQSPSAAAAGK